MNGVWLARQCVDGQGSRRDPSGYLRGFVEPLDRCPIGQGRVGDFAGDFPEWRSRELSGPLVPGALRVPEVEAEAAKTGIRSPFARRRRGETAGRPVATADLGPT